MSHICMIVLNFPNLLSGFRQAFKVYKWNHITSDLLYLCISELHSSLFSLVPRVSQLSSPLLIHLHIHPSKLKSTNPAEGRDELNPLLVDNRIPCEALSSKYLCEFAPAAVHKDGWAEGKANRKTWSTSENREPHSTCARARTHWRLGDNFFISFSSRFVPISL